MNSQPWPAGLIPALVTRFQDDRVHLEAVAALIDSQIDDGVAGLVVGGGTGNSAAHRRGTHWRGR